MWALWALPVLAFGLIVYFWRRSKRDHDQARVWEEQIAETLARTGGAGPATRPPGAPVTTRQRVETRFEAPDSLAELPPIPQERVAEPPKGSVTPASVKTTSQPTLTSQRVLDPSPRAESPSTSVAPPAPTPAVKSQLQGLLVDPEIAMLSRALAPEQSGHSDEMSLTRKLEVIQAQAEEAARSKSVADTPRGRYADPELESRDNASQKAGKGGGQVDADPAQVKNYRLRYMEERFPEIANGTINLNDPDSVIKGARLFFEDGAGARAQELLLFSVEENPQAIPIWLAMFEIYRLEQNAVDFAQLAKRYKQVHEFDANWPKIQAIGIDLDGANPMYHERPTGLDVDHVATYDPLAENWLNSPIDFTPDVLAIELRQSLLQAHQIYDADLVADPLPVVKELVQVPTLD
jgi:hypothetical protein